MTVPKSLTVMGSFRSNKWFQSPKLEGLFASCGEFKCLAVIFPESLKCFVEDAR